MKAIVQPARWVDATYVRIGSKVLIKSPMTGLRLVLERLARDFDLIFLNASVGAGLH
jgi:hypothetical protein